MNDGRDSRLARNALQSAVDHFLKGGPRMAKYVFWSVLNGNRIIALDEHLSRYAAGETFWQALRALLTAHPEFPPSVSSEEADPAARRKMFVETGIHKIEIFVEKDGRQFSVRCANSRCQWEEMSESAALLRYVEVRAKTSLVNSGGSA
jgi:hypothetical protein